MKQVNIKPTFQQRYEAQTRLEQELEQMTKEQNLERFRSHRVSNFFNFLSR